MVGGGGCRRLLSSVGFMRRRRTSFFVRHGDCQFFADMTGERKRHILTYGTQVYLSAVCTDETYISSWEQALETTRHHDLHLDLHRHSLGICITTTLL